MRAAAKILRYWGKATLVVLLLGTLSAAHAEDDHPLRPPDASSPRATLQSFLAVTDDIYRSMKSVLEGYATSDRLYLSAQEHQQQRGALEEAPKLVHYLDLSGVTPVLVDTVSMERVLQLREILDRIPVPPFADIPDQNALGAQPAKRWRLPNTEIDVVRIENGPRAGDYVISAETVERLPAFYRRVRNLPYKPGPGEDLAKVYRALSQNPSATIYEAFLSSPAGLSFLVPPRWMLSLPSWAQIPVGGLTAWQWLGLAVGLLIGALIIWLGHHPTRRQSDGRETGPRWGALLLPFAILFVAGVLVPLFDMILRIGGNLRVAIEYGRIAAVYLAAAWLAVTVSAVLGEAAIGSERLTIGNFDDQLIRLGARLVGVVAAIAILIRGGDELGFPAYSVLAGLGVGGLAVALAAQTTIANLIGSLLIALEKPFRVGQRVRIAGTEGTVEDVGFRCTHIRTLDNSLVSIPSSSVVNTAVENLSVRPKRRQRFLVQVTYNTSCGKLEQVMAAISDLLAAHPLVEQGTYHVRLNNFGESSLDILIIFHLLVTDNASELREREAVLLKIMRAVAEAGAEFAFPTRTLYVEHPAQGFADIGAATLDTIRRPPKPSYRTGPLA
jgi:MscS family membrane protein